MAHVVARYLVFYRQLPAELEKFVLTDGYMFILKDGIKVQATQVFNPRLTITVQENPKQDSKKRVEKLEKVLKQLLATNQIIEFK